MQIPAMVSLQPIALLVLLFVSIPCEQLSAQQLNAYQPTFCDKDTAKAICTITKFDRVANTIGGNPVVKTTDPHQVWAINSPASKILYSGTLVSAPYPDEPLANGRRDCSDSDWRLVVLSEESSNVLI
jgi:hypothetical protein